MCTNFSENVIAYLVQSLCRTFGRKTVKSQYDCTIDDFNVSYILSYENLAVIENYSDQELSVRIFGLFT